uniref:Uncharacterized protein n=1 Tax=Schizaphis graminum TaxID=13262 RepID=A0A2S2NM38_SCHGA
MMVCVIRVLFVLKNSYKNPISIDMLKTYMVCIYIIYLNNFTVHFCLIFFFFIAVSRIQSITRRNDGRVEISPNIFVPDVPAEPSNTRQDVTIPSAADQWDDGDDALFLEVLQNAENSGLCDMPAQVVQHNSDKVEISPNIFVPDIPAGPSNTRQNVTIPSTVEQWDDGDDALFLEVLKNAENSGLCDVSGTIF